MKKVEGAQFLQWFGPLLDALRALGGSGTPDEVVDKITTTLKIPDEQLNETLPSGGSRFKNQVAFARLYLAFEGLLDSSRRGVEPYGKRTINVTFYKKFKGNISEMGKDPFREEKRAKRDKRNTRRASGGGCGSAIPRLSRENARPASFFASGRL